MQSVFRCKLSRGLAGRAQARFFDQWAAQFRNSFELGSRSSVQYFPGHMAKGLEIMQYRAPHVDCIILVHDARIPFSGYCTQLRDAMGDLPMVLVLNKADLVPRRQLAYAVEQLKTQMPGVEITTAITSRRSAKTDKTVRDILPKVLSIIDLKVVAEKRAASRQDMFCRLMIAGIPNVGKSSIINAFRRIYAKKGTATRVGALPGITRSVLQEIRVYDKPKTYIVDTPGVLNPGIPNAETGLRLALIGTISDHRVGEMILADYLLYTLNRYRLFAYVTMYNLPNPSDDIKQVLIYVCRWLNAVLKGGKPDYLRGAVHFIRQYREGKLGRVMLDLDPKEVFDMQHQRL